MSKVQVLIAGVLLKQDQADAVLCAAEIMFHRCERFLKDVRYPTRDKVDEHLNNYLRGAEIIRLFEPDRPFSYIHFVHDRACLNDTVDALFHKHKH